MKTTLRLLEKKRRRRRLQIEQLEARFVLNGQALLANDAFTVHQNAPQSALQVLANDVFEAGYTGQRRITSVSFGSQGGRLAISADKHSLLYTPPADFSGVETFDYAVDGRYTAQVEMSVVAPLSTDHYQIPPDGAERTLDVLANDPFWSGYSGPRQITSVSVGSAGGTIRISADRRSILYTPPDHEFGTETFTYVVDEQYPMQVTIDVPKTLNGDTFEFVKYEPPATLDVLANDPFWAGYSGARQITHVTTSQIGASIQISGDGRSLIYTQPASFDYDYAWRLTDTFKYVVDGGYEASVTIVLHRPVQDDWFDVDENSTGYFYNVTGNDWYRDDEYHLHDVIDHVTSVTQPESGGNVIISPDGRGILYTPPAGFTGDDHFTYIADGAHEARVDVHVTRPVRDDRLSAFQDTPNVVLNVLGNDFAGNGYTGPRLITAIGPTLHGGTLTIRADGKAILYTPPAGYTGEDYFTYTVDGLLQANVALQVVPLALSDNVKFYPDPGSRPYTINVLANDYFTRGYAGAGVITAVEVVSGSGQVSVQNGRIVFDPTAAGAHTLRYTVDAQYHATVSVWIENVAYADHAVVDENSQPNDILVLTNDFYINYPPYSYSGPRLITGVTQSQHGGVVTFSADGHSVQYKPAADFLGEDTFTYTVDNFMTATVTVEVIRRVRDDHFRVDTSDGAQVLPVLVNDPFGADYAGPGQITAVTPTAGGGTVTISADHHSIVYKRRAGFIGTDTFTYTVDGTQKAQVSVVIDAPQTELAQKFTGLDDYVQFLINDALARYDQLFGQPTWVYTYLTGTTAYLDDTSRFSGTIAHSETNVQVAGVDEGDIVAFDSGYIYMLTGGEVVIASAWPADQMSVASRVAIEGRPIAEYLQGDRLTVISTLGGGFNVWGSFNSEPISTGVTVLDVSNRNAPRVVQETRMDGQYIDSRAVSDFVYVLVNNTKAVAPEPLLIDADNDPATPARYETHEEYLSRVMANPGKLIEAALPQYTSSGPDGQTVRAGLLNSPEGIYRPLVDGAQNLLSVVSFSVTGDKPGLADTSAVYSTGARTIYASLDHFYVFDTDWSHEDGAVTRIVKFDWQPATGGIEFDATTTVPGSIINQFSADESGAYLRIATTVHNDQSGNWTGRDENLLFVLAEDDGVFEYVGGLHNLALDESIRSVRFLGDRAFITTFRDVDPLFAIDLSDLAHPESVGHITIPGYTSYMQLVDQNHLLTVGRNTPYGAGGPTQVALFDISDLLQPLRIAEYTFERFSTSEAELDHHAFGYYADFGLLAMPISTDRIERVDLDGDGYGETSQTVHEYQLAVFSVDVNVADPADRLILKSEIAHGAPVRRSGFIGDKLYSVADDSVKVVDIAAPDVVVAQLTIPLSTDAASIVPIPLFNASVIDLADVWRLPPVLLLSEDPLALPVPKDPLSLAIEQAREDLAERLHGADGEPLFVTAEASPTETGGYSVVFQVRNQNYLYHTSAIESVQLIDANFHFSELAGAWHAVDARIPTISPAAVPEPSVIPQVIDVTDVVVPGVPAKTVEPQQAALSDSGSELHYAPALNGFASDFAHLGMIGAHAPRHRSLDEAFGQIDGGSKNSRLVLLTALKSRPHNERDAQMDSGPVENQDDASNCDLADIDGAFESLMTLRTAKNSHGRSLVGRR